MVAIFCPPIIMTKKKGHWEYERVLLQFDGEAKTESGTAILLVLMASLQTLDLSS